MKYNIILMLVFAVIIALFAIVNSTVVTVSFMFAEINVSLALVIIVSALIGAIIIILFDSFQRIKTNKQIKQLNKKIQESDKALAEKDAEIERAREQLVNKDKLIEEYKEKDKIVTNQE